MSDKTTIVLAGELDCIKKALCESYSVISAENGSRAVEIIRENSGACGAIILDITCLDILGKMRSDEKLANIPVIAAIPENSPESCRLAVKLGASDYLPLNADEDLTKLRVRNVLLMNKTSSQKPENELSESFNQLKALIDDSPDGIAFTSLGKNGEPKTRYINRVLAGKLGFNDYEAALESVLRGETAVFGGSVRSLIDEAFETEKPIRFEMSCRAADGKNVDFLVNGKIICGDAGEKLLYSVFTDITSEAERSKKLLETAYSDPLTGFRNRAAFIRDASAEIRENPLTEYTMMLLNVGSFRITNSYLGKTEGDRLLRTIAEALSDTLGETGVFARYYADRFVILTPYSERSVHPQSILDAVRGAVVKNCAATGEISFYMGVYKIDDRSVSVEEMVKRALIACCSISGKNRDNVVYFDEKMRAALLEEQTIAKECYSALKNGEFSVVYQPIYGIRSKKFVSAEALVRWNHPKSGVILPEKFLPIFEENGFAAELDEFVIDAVLHFQKKRRDEGFEPFPISVNISNTSLCSPHLFEMIYMAAVKYGVKPEYLRPEIDAASMNGEVPQMIEAIKRLRSAGFPVLLDNFGGNNSSLHILRKVPFDILKLDMKYLKDYEKSEKTGAIITSMVRTSKWLNSPLLAKGVETREQFEYLESVGCEYIQGYFFSLPVYENVLCAIIENGGATAEETAVERYGMDAEINKLFGNDAILSKLIGSIFGGFGIYEMSGGRLEVIRVNEEYLNIMGCSSQESFLEENTNVWEHLYPDDVEISKNACLEAVRTGKPVRAVCRRYNKNGDLIYLDSIHRRLGGTDENPIISISLFDITDKIHASEKPTAALGSDEERLEREKNDNLLRKTVRHIPMGLGIFRYTAEGSVPVYFSDRMYKILGENSKLSFRSLGKLLEQYKIKPEGSGERVFSYVLPNGKHIWLKAVYRCIKENDATMIYTVISDESEAVESRMRDAARDRVYQVLVGEINVMIFSYSPAADEIVYYHGENGGAACSVTLKGISRDISVFSTLCENDRQDFVNVLKKLSDKEGTETMILKMLTEGYPRRHKATIRSICDDNGIVFRIVGKLEDVEDEMSRIEEIQSRAMYDSLCVDVFNKATTEELIRGELERSTTGALIMLDVDEFKSINDRLGHVFGDEFLKTFAAAVKKVFGSSDIVGRYGGDEFFAFIPHATALLARKKGNQILEAISKINIPELSGIKCSVGISVTTPDNRNYVQLLKQADSALYQAKNRGKNCVVMFDPKLMNEISYRTEEAVIKGRESVSLSANPSGASSLMMRVFSLLYSGADIEGGINEALRFVGENFDVSRVYIFENSADGEYCSNTFEWCAEGIQPEIDILQNIPYNSLGESYRKTLKNDGIIYCRDTSELDDATRKFHEKQDIKSMLECAIMDNGEFRGFVGFDECRENRFWTKEQIDSLAFLSKVLSVFLMKSRKGTAIKNA